MFSGVKNILSEHSPSHSRTENQNDHFMSISVENNNSDVDSGRNSNEVAEEFDERIVNDILEENKNVNENNFLRLMKYLYLLCILILYLLFKF